MLLSATPVMRVPSKVGNCCRRSSLWLILSGIVALCAQRTSGQKRGSMQRFKFPSGAVECKTGDYLIVESGARQWTVYKVEDLVLFSRLLPVRFQSGVELMEERHMLDSQNPAYTDQIFLLLAVYDQRFVSMDEAKAAIRSVAQHNVRTGYYVNVKEFSQTSTLVITEH